MQVFQLFYFLLLYSNVNGGHHGYFGYLPAEQSEWGAHFPQCKGQKQSPIHIKTKKAVGANIGPIKYFGYGKNMEDVRIKNNGHTVSVLFEPKRPCDSVPSIYAKFLKGKYCFKEMHWHWGVDDSSGSEHMIDEIKTPLELHIVHERRNAFVVLGVLYQLGAENIGLESVIRNMHLVNNAETIAAMKGRINLFTMLHGIHRNNFFHYPGSLTTPPCSENVLWVVFNKTLTVSSAQIKAFRGLNTVDKNGSPMKLMSNHRLPMPLNGRSVVFRQGGPFAAVMKKPRRQKKRTGITSHQDIAAPLLVWPFCVGYYIVK